MAPDQAAWVTRVEALIATWAPDLGKWLALNLALLTIAVLQLWRGARSGNGGLTLGALSRALPLQEGEQARGKRLARLLRNEGVEGSAMTPYLVRLALGAAPPDWVPIVVDQTWLRGTPTLMAGILVANRVLPVAFTGFDYPGLRTSQNALEEALLLLVVGSLPPGCKPLFVMDRGYARAALLKTLRELGIPYLIRGRATTLVSFRGSWRALGRLPHRPGEPVRYRAADQSRAREPVDVVIFRDPAFREAWYLLVPPDSACALPTEEVIALYRRRMHIELTFRDWKTHLGLRRLRLEVDIPQRLGRWVLVLTIAYLVAVLLGAGPAARRVRRDCEVLRPTPRHGTRRRLSALSVAILLLSLARFAGLARRSLAALLAALQAGTAAATLASAGP